MSDAVTRLRFLRSIYIYTHTRYIDLKSGPRVTPPRAVLIKPGPRQWPLVIAGEVVLRGPKTGINGGRERERERDNGEYLTKGRVISGAQ